MVWKHTRVQMDSVGVRIPLSSLLLCCSVEVAISWFPQTSWKQDPAQGPASAFPADPAPEANRSISWSIS